MTGFYEDLPTLLIVILSLFIFFGQVAAMYDTYDARWERLEAKNDAMAFPRLVRGYEGLVHESREGVFEATKVDAMSSQRLNADLQPGFDFHIAIYDLGDYPVAYNATYASAPLPEGPDDYRTGIYVNRLSVLIWVNEEELHPAVMIVSTWE